MKKRSERKKETNEYWKKTFKMKETEKEAEHFRSEKERNKVY